MFVGEILTIAYTGKPQKLTLPAGKFRVYCHGACASDSPGSAQKNDGAGANAVGTLELDNPLTVYVYVGGNTGRFNGGATNTRAWSGGATDIRLFGGLWNDTRGLASRIIIAGGGGTRGAPNKYGGFGGGLAGSTRTESYGTGGVGGGQVPIPFSGSFGAGGDGVVRTGGYGGAGGGGYYGGGGVTPDGSGDDDRGGGGGSGFISGVADCNAVGYFNNLNPSSQTYHYSGLIFSDGYFQSGSWYESGKVIIEVLALSGSSIYAKVGGAWQSIN